MKLFEALLITLYVMNSKVSTQFTWNLQLFLVYMWCSDVIKMRPFKFVATPFGAWCHRVIKEIDYLEDKGYISSSYSDLCYIAEIDKLINEDFFDTTTSYWLTDAGEKYVKKICTFYKIDLTKIDFSSMFFMLDDAEIPFIISVIREHFPEMVKRRVSELI
jgi:hypothetical protein